LIFCGSLLTHLPEAGAHATLRAITRALGANGLAIVTVHGRHSGYIQRHKWKYVEDDLFDSAEQRAERIGFGYVDYQGEMRARFEARTRYGLALVRPSWVMAQLEAESRVRIWGYSERAWNDHQDVVVFGRPGVDD
jgi:hypothetical protein